MADDSAAAVAEDVDDTAVGHTDTDAAVAQVAQEQVELESRARRMGWRPKDEFRGDVSRWTDAKSFIDRGEAELPVLRERYRALDDRFARLEERSLTNERDLTQKLTEVSQAFGEFREFARSADERAYIRAKRELEARMEAAVQTADHATYRSAKAELESLESRPPPPPKKAETAQPAEQRDQRPQPQTHPDVTAWIGDNQGWFNTDPTMTQYAVAVHGQLLRDRPGLSMRDNLAIVREDVVSRFPEKFENRRRQAPAAVATTNTAQANQKKGKYPEYDKWPADAKAAFAKFSRQMPNYTKEEYAKLYFAGDES